MMDKLGSAVMTCILLYIGYRLLNNWAVAEFGVVRVWEFKRALLTIRAAVYIGCGLFALFAIYIATKLDSPRMLFAVVCVAACVPFCIWLHGYLGSRYFNFIGKTFFYGVTAIGTLLLLSALLAVPLAVVRRFMDFSRENLARRRMHEARAVAVIADAKARYRQSQYITTAGRYVLAIDTETGKQKYFIAPTAADLDRQEEPPEEASLTALDIGLRIQRAFMWGATRGGKSRFAQTLAHHLLKRGDIVVALDPEAYDPDQPWPLGVEVVGQHPNGDGDNFDQIEQFFDRLDAEKERRGRNMRATKRSAPAIYIFFDEINQTLMEKPKLTERYLKVFRRYSKYKIFMICIGQTDDVESIGMKNKGKLKFSFDVILRFHCDQKSGKRYSYADFQDGRGYIELESYTPVDLSRTVEDPPLYPRFEQKTMSESGFDTFDTSTVLPLDQSTGPPVEPAQTPAIRYYESFFERDVCRAADKGAVSKSQICEVVGKPNNGKWMRVVGEILEKHQITLNG